MTAVTIVQEFCRRRAVQLVGQGESKDVIARMLGVSRTSINVWWRRACAGEDLTHKPKPGRPRRLDDTQLKELAELLTKGAEAHGWQNQGQRSLKRCPGKHFQQEVLAPAAGATFSHDAVLAGMLF